MIAAVPILHRLARFWGAGVLLLVWLALQLGGGLETWGYARGAIEQGAWWRLLTGQFVHLNMAHLGLNALGLLGVVSLWHQALCGGRPLAYSLVLALSISAGLWLFQPSLAFYAGASGVVHGLFVMGLMLSSEIKKPWRALAATAFIIKLYAETQLPSTSAELIGAPVIYSAHQFGAFSALILSVWIIWLKRRR